ncbi:MAG: hypothetical protein NTZ40_03185, partial [Cyanobacteria bacterium]|nr:hypothetical protein [Cyanobacteriota bacterium]
MGSCASGVSIPATKFTQVAPGAAGAPAGAAEPGPPPGALQLLEQGKGLGDVCRAEHGPLVVLKLLVQSALLAAFSLATVAECRNIVKAFSIRQLKSNPSTVLRAAEQDAMALVTSHQQPTALVVALDRLGLP